MASSKLSVEEVASLQRRLAELQQQNHALSEENTQLQGRLRNNKSTSHCHGIDASHTRDLDIESSGPDYLITGRGPYDRSQRQHNVDEVSENTPKGSTEAVRHHKTILPSSSFSSSKLASFPTITNSFVTAQVTVSLMDLPNELIALISRLLYARDLENFVLVSRRIYQQSRGAMVEHQLLKHQYSTIVNGQPPLTAQNFGQLGKLVVKISKQPHLALYIETLRIHDWFIKWPNDAGQDAFPNYPLEELVEMCLAEYRDDIRPWEWECFTSEDEEGAFSLLLLNLPNLRTLELDVSDKWGDLLCIALDHVINMPASDILTKIENLIITEATQGACHFQTLRRFIELPSLRSVRVTGLMDNVYDDHPMRAGTNFSNVVSLSFLDCAFRSQHFFSVLSCMTKLTHFSCVCQFFLDNANIDPYWIISGLRSSSRHTLQAFEILGYHIKDKTVPSGPIYWSLGSLSDFTVLTKLTINIELLVCGEYFKKVYLSNDLPISVRQAVFHVDAKSEERATRWCDDISDLCRDHIEDDRRLLPELKDLEFKGDPTGLGQIKNPLEESFLPLMRSHGVNISWSETVDD